MYKGTGHVTELGILLFVRIIAIHTCDKKIIYHSLH